MIESFRDCAVIRILTLLAVHLTYQYLVAFFTGLTVVSAMDQACFIGPNTAYVNFHSCTFLEGEFTEESLTKLYMKFPNDFAKFRYRIKMIGGDPYYEEMSIQEAWKKAFIFEKNPNKVFKSQREIEMYAEDNINSKFPLDGPQWRLYG